MKQKNNTSCGRITRVRKKNNFFSCSLFRIENCLYTYPQPSVTHTHTHTVRTHIPQITDKSSKISTWGVQSGYKSTLALLNHNKAHTFHCTALNFCLPRISFFFVRHIFLCSLTFTEWYIKKPVTTRRMNKVGTTHTLLGNTHRMIKRYGVERWSEKKINNNEHVVGKYENGENRHDFCRFIKRWFLFTHWKILYSIPYGY